MLRCRLDSVSRKRPGIELAALLELASDHGATRSFRPRVARFFTRFDLGANKLPDWHIVVAASSDTCL